MAYFVALALLAYLLGSVPSGLIITRLLGGPDPRQAGSCNPGAANVYRLMGHNAGLLTLAGDAVKGAVPVLLALYGFTSLGAWREAAVAVVGAAAAAGHMFSIFLSFQGGKGVATSFGVVAVLSPWAALNLLVVYLLAVARARIFAVASLLCAWLLPLAMGLFSDSKAYLLLAGVLSGLILLKHQDNLKRLVQGEEPRIS